MSETALSAELQVWLADALLEGVDADDLVDHLVSRGVERDLASATIAEIAASPAFLAGRRRVRVLRLQQAVARAGSGAVERRPGLDPAVLRDTYVAHGVPVVVPGFCAEWPAASWTPEALVERLGDAEIQVCVGRDTVEAPDGRFRELTTTMTLADYVARVRAAGRTNDLYTIANHRNLDGPLAPLLDDLDPPDEVVQTDKLLRNTSLWLGPAGTRTPLHHDVSSVLFCQLYGRKRVRLVPPWAHDLTRAARGYYSSVGLDDPASTAPGGPLDGVAVSDVVVGPGDMVLLPAGWWHEVEALDVSISVSLVALRWQNRFEFYVAGAP